MRNILFAIAAVLLINVMHAQSVSVENAKIAARNFLSAAEPSQTINQLSLYQTINDNHGINVMYIFNIDDYGFVIFGADESYDPLIGYSFSGVYDSSSAAPTLKSWLKSFTEDVEAIRNTATKRGDITKYHKDCQKKWDDLLSGNTSKLASKSSKGVNSLVQTKWDQGGGYNNYCPVYSYGPNGHSHTGCVATAMAQIIRYHRYPTTGFSRFSYNHSYHGRQYAAFDSVTFDYLRMPTQVSTNSLAVSQHNVSLLCYYCGVSVKMNYLNPNHTTGSGAYSYDVPHGFQYFGYANAYYMAKPNDADLWDSLLRNELDHARPVYYSGSNSDGGHAFVVDGYRNNGTYSFNFGWSGGGDGYYTISNAGGFTATQGAVLNIIPSGLTAHGDTIYIDADGDGGGSSWQDASPNLHDAINIARICCKKNGKKTIWVKNGTYYGNESAPYSFQMASRINIYGGFNGTESSLDERTGEGKSVMSGAGKRIAFFSHDSISNAAIYDMTFSDGYADDGAGVFIHPGVRVERCTIENNTATSGAALLAINNTVYNSIIHNNHCGGVHLLNSGSLRNSLVAHNAGFGINLEASSINGCNVVCNEGVGVLNMNNEGIRNSVIWRNDSQLGANDLSNIYFSAIEGIGERDTNSNFGLDHENRPENGVGPMFMNPDLTLGISENLGDWHISSRSPLVDAGDTNRSGAYIYELGGDSRFRNGRADIGCYEWIPGNAVQEVSSTNATLYPNPATNSVTVNGLNGVAVIFDIMGRQVKSIALNGDSATIDISNLPNGLYIIRSGNTSIKFMKR
ncbi:MAG: C10 family peptidase [Bacteroidales bacterium]|nr:C10 family peptidase [Bacteroidales bacterium]